MIKHYQSEFYAEPIEVENIDGDITVSILDRLERESIYTWYNIKEKSTQSDYINKWILWGLMQESVNKVLVLWAGAGAYIKYIEDHFIYSEITAVDIDPVMVEIAKNELKVETKNIVIDDVLQFTDKLVKKGEQFDLILFDIYGATGEIPKHVISEKLYKNLSKLLYSSWVFSINYANFFLKSYDIVDQERKKKYVIIHKELKEIFWDHFISFLSPESEGWNVSVSYNLDKEYNLADIKKEYFRKVKFEDIDEDDNLIENIILDEKRVFLR